MKGMAAKADSAVQATLELPGDRQISWAKLRAVVGVVESLFYRQLGSTLAALVFVQQVHANNDLGDVVGRADEHELLRSGLH